MAQQTMLRSFIKSLVKLTHRSQSSSGTDLAGPEVSGAESPFYVVSAVIGWFSEKLSRQAQKSLLDSINQELLLRYTPKTIIQCPHKIWNDPEILNLGGHMKNPVPLFSTFNVRQHV